jgi:hypothetical protein
MDRSEGRRGRPDSPAARIAESHISRTVRYQPEQASCTSPAVIAAAVADGWAWPPRAVPGFVVTAMQPFCTFVPGCSGKVEPGGPASANADAAVAPQRVRAHVAASRRRLITDLPSGLREGVSTPKHLDCPAPEDGFVKNRRGRPRGTRTPNSSPLCSSVGPTLKPPSSATSRTLIPSRLSSATVPGKSVSSAGLPSSVEAAPRILNEARADHRHILLGPPALPDSLHETLQDRARLPPDRPLRPSTGKRCWRGPAPTRDPDSRRRTGLPSDRHQQPPRWPTARTRRYPAPPLASRPTRGRRYYATSSRGMSEPKLVTGDGALGLWGALRDVFPRSKRNRITCPCVCNRGTYPCRNNRSTDRTWSVT